MLGDAIVRDHQADACWAAEFVEVVDSFDDCARRSETDGVVLSLFRVQQDVEVDQTFTLCKIIQVITVQVQAVITVQVQVL